MTPRANGCNTRDYKPPPLLPTACTYLDVGTLQARIAEAEETVTADNELGELASFLNGEGGSDGAGKGWQQELSPDGVAKKESAIPAVNEDDEVGVVVLLL